MALEIDLEKKLVKAFIMIPNMAPIVVEKGFISAYAPKENIMLLVNADEPHNWYLVPANQCIVLGSGAPPTVTEIEEEP